MCGYVVEVKMMEFRIKLFIGIIRKEMFFFCIGWLLVGNCWVVILFLCGKILFVESRFGVRVERFLNTLYVFLESFILEVGFFSYIS